MSGSDPDIEVLGTEVPPPPAGTPWFRELVALALKTTDTTVLDAAEQDYRGVFASLDDFIHNQLGEHLPPICNGCPRAAIPRNSGSAMNAGWSGCGRADCRTGG